MKQLEELTAIQTSLAWLLANVPDALTGPLREDARRVLEDLILRHSRLQGRVAQENSGLSLIIFGDAKTADELEDRFRQFMAETVVDRGEDELLEEMIDAGVRNLEAEGETVEEVNADDLPPEDCWSPGPVTEVVEKPFEGPDPGDPPITDRVTE